MAGFEPATAANSGPLSIFTNSTPDVLEWLPAGAADRLRTLRQHAADLHNLTVPFSDIQAANTARIQAENRLAQLLAHRSESGFNLSVDDPSVIAQQRLVEKLTAEYKRLNERNDARAAAWTTAQQTATAVETWLRDGRPAGTVLEDHDVEAPKPQKGENGLLDQIENRRRRVRELKANLHTIRSAPYLSTHAKAKMRAEIEALAMQGAPDFTNLIEHDGKIVWPMTTVQLMVHNVETPAIGFAQVPDTLALDTWSRNDALIKQYEAEIDAQSDDASALSHEVREQREAEVMGDLLAVERDEAALVWRGMSERLPVEHRRDCSPQAILQVASVVVPRAAVPDTTPGHAFNVVHGQGRRR